MSVLSLIVVSFATFLLVIGGVALLFFGHFRNQSTRLGYRSLGEYLGAVPVTDEQKRDAVSLALKGVVTCVLGLLFPPFLVIGLVPLFFGARKMAWVSMGLGLVDDADHASR